MTLTSTIEIDVSDAKFQRFADMFKKYEEALAKTPDIWKKVAAQQSAGAIEFEKQTRSLAEQVDAHRELADALDKQNVTLEHTDRLWTTMARTTKEVSGNIVSATTSLLRWTGILGFVGSALGIGGFLGMEHLSNSVGGQRRSALGRGMSIGEQSAFGIHLGRFVDAESFMSKVAGMELDVTQRPYGLGVPFTGKTGPDAEALLRAAYYKTRSITDPGLVKPIMGALAPGMFDDDALMRFRTMQPSEFETQMRANAKDKSVLNIQEKVAKDWQDAATSIERTRAAFEKISADALDPLARKIPALTEEFTKLIGAFAKWPIIKEAIDDIAGVLGNITHPGRLLSGALSGTADWMISSDPLGLQSSASWFLDKSGLGNWAHGLEKNHLSKYLSWLDLSRNIGPGTLEMIAQLESSGNPNAVGPKTRYGTAKGMFGLMDMNSKGIDPFDPVAAAARAAEIIGQLMREFHGNQAQVLAAYNWNPAGVEGAIARYGAAWRQALPPETQNYVHKAEIIIQNNTGGSATVAGSQVGGQ